MKNEMIKGAKEALKYLQGGKKKGRILNRFIHPGEILADDLQALGMSAAELARHLKVPTNRVTEILNGQRAITGDTALRLGHYLNTSAQFWLNLQSNYELRLAEQKAGKAIKALPTLKSRKSRENTHPVHA